MKEVEKIPKKRESPVDLKIAFVICSEIIVYRKNYFFVIKCVVGI